jgi:hypothetical protein
MKYRFLPSPQRMRMVLVLGMLFVLTVGFASFAFATLPGSTFNAGDANLILDGTPTDVRDWANVSFLPKADLPTGQTDNSFTEGTKEDTLVPTIEFGSIPPNKSDLLWFYNYAERIGNNWYLNLAWVRVQDPSGTTNMDFEFNQSEVLSSNGITFVRTAGDILIKYDLSNGGTNPTMGYHRWVVAGACEANGTRPPCWGPVQPIDNQNFEASINLVAVADPVAGTSWSPRTFGEAAINLTGLGILPTTDGPPCLRFSSAFVKSRSSDSFTAVIKDFIAPVPTEIGNCPTV